VNEPLRKELNKNTVAYEKNYQARHEYVTRFMEKHDLSYGARNTNNIIVKMIQEENNSLWNKLVEEEEELKDKSRRFKKALGLYSYDPCADRDCVKNCDMTSPECALSRREKIITKYGKEHVL